MKKLLMLIFAFVLTSALIFSQEQRPVRKQTQHQSKEQFQAQTKTQSGDPIMINQRARMNDAQGQGPETREQRRTVRREMNQKNGTCANPEKPMTDPKQGKHLKMKNARPPMHAAPGRMGMAQRNGRR